MPQLEWSEALALGLPAMDDLHREFVYLLEELQAAGEDALVAHWTVLIAHTEQHFAIEDGWMRATRFATSGCHRVEHQVVLQTMREGLQQGRDGHPGSIRQLAHELAFWFPRHVQAMDAPLAMHLRNVCFDPATGAVRLPAAAPIPTVGRRGRGHRSDRALVAESA